MRSSLTFWVLLAAIVSALLQVFPVTGIIFMMLQSMFNLNAIHIVALAVAIVVDSLLGTLPRPLALLPVVAALAFGGWYWQQYDAERAPLAAVTTELQARNKGLLLRYDPSAHALVDQPADVMVLYDVPRLYKTNVGSKATSPFILETPKPITQCSRDTTAGLPRDNVAYGNIMRTLICYHQQWSGAPTLPQLELRNADGIDEQLAGLKIHTYANVLTLSGAPLGTHTTGSAELLPAWPNPLIGCFLNPQEPRWLCTATLRRERIQLNTNPAPWPADASTLQVVLGLKSRPAEEIARLTERPPA